MKKYRKSTWLLLGCMMAVFLVMAGCGSDKKNENEPPKDDKASQTEDSSAKSKTEKDEISEGAKKTLELMTICPNEELYNEETMTYPIGLTEEEVTEEQKEAANQAAEEAFEKWKSYIGEYYDEKGLESARNNGTLTYYLSRNQKIEMRKLEVVEKTDKLEKVKATVLVDGLEEITIFNFRRNDNGLIWTIELVNE